ncbi:winged helix-turn-helix domain-containing protein [Streptomyces sp. NPDC005408]|uniref:winged helix-turn-helix domain-containing protein n=1 Tax=Streptomyces sp. NPDC005408 TaxID=3155341 RepID=UPI0033BD20E5
MRNDSGRVAHELRERIRKGHLKPGDRVPAQAELAEEFAVDRGTVRMALRALHDEGLLAPAVKGAAARVATPRDSVTGDDASPHSALTGLGPRLLEAFSVPDIRIDALCLTAETLILALAGPLLAIHQGRIRPSSVRVRVLLPSRDIALAFPAPVEASAGDNGVHERWLAQRNAQEQVLRHNLLALRTGYGVDVEVSFRAPPFTPPVKLYLLNGSEALFAYYTITRREEEMGGESLEMYDALGVQSQLYSFLRGADSRDTAFVEQSGQWFEALWDTLGTDLALTVD